MKLDHIHVKNACQHNLKSVTVDIPKEKLVIITGPSGSGKSSLAFDTIYAECHRRYVESLSAYARQFLNLMEKPDVELIAGLSPAISIEQKTASRNPRSTVGTITEIYDYLRLLFARIGTPHCPECGTKISAISTSHIIASQIALPEKTKLTVLAPIIRGRKGEYQQLFKDMMRQGFTRVRVNGDLVRLEEAPKLNKQKKHTIEVVVDRIAIRKGIKQRIADAIELATKLAAGLVTIDNNDTDTSTTFNTRHGCIDCGFAIDEIEPRLFSFNTPYGACPDCGGLGYTQSFNEDLVIADMNKSILQGGVAALGKLNPDSWEGKRLQNVAEHYGFTLDTPLKKLTKRQLQTLLYGSDEEIEFNYVFERSDYNVTKTYEGVITRLQRLYDNARDHAEDFAHYMHKDVCKDCDGLRINPIARHIFIQKKSIANVCQLQVRDALRFFDTLKLTTMQQQIANKVLKEINERLHFLDNVGVGYLSLDRTGATLSGGEAQRIRLATQIGSALSGVIYVLDEPSIGLHPRDNSKLLNTLKRLRDIGNTIIVVEHDEETMLASDYIIDIGPGAGRHGGEIVATGTPEQIKANPDSLTGQYLSGRQRIEPPKGHKRPEDRGFISLKGCHKHNLKGVDAQFPIGAFTCITGVSGSGKSTLVMDLLLNGVQAKLNRKRKLPQGLKSITGLEDFERVIHLDQTAIGRTPRSNPATYTGVYGPIRELFASLPESKIRGYKPGRFSFNVKGGRCATCSGDGILRIEMNFMPDVFVKCSECKGKRFNPETLEITYRGKTIADVLDMSVNEAAEFFQRIPTLRNKLTLLNEVGLDYIALGQAATTLSGGEAQRIKISKELSKRDNGKTLYILDEPTTGLHFDDVKKLITILMRLRGKGNTLCVIEHNLHVIKCADHIIDLGPEGGDGGGRIVAKGTPQKIQNSKRSLTGQYLRDFGFS